MQELIENGDGFRALTRLKEREFQNRGTPLGHACAREILKLYIENKEYQWADEWLDRLAQQEHLSAPLAEQLKSELAFVFGNYPEASARAEGETFSSKTRLVYAAEVLEKPGIAATRSCNEPVCQELAKLREAPEWQQRKSPTLALVWGILPGGGQIYVGRTAAGFTSLVVNSLLIWLTVYAVQQDERALSWLTGVTAAGLYTGSLYAGYESALRHNEQLDARFRERAQHLDFKMKLLEWNW